MNKSIKKKSLGLALAIVFLAGSTAAQAGLKEGVAAYRKGSFSVALKELTPLAEQGEMKAQLLLGDMYSGVRGVPQDHAKAAFWYRKAADQGSAPAQTSLGVMYEKGIGVKQDEREAVSLYQKAAEQGFAEAQYVLGGMYERGQGTVQADLVQAHKWFNLAVAAGFGAAQDNMERIEARMSPEQIEKAKSLAKEWLAKHKPVTDSGAHK
ncbi:MAG: sel1 repeat family protein [Betaproteobacteria bacterium]|nr:sel1 repeat family protein [Betaproteobacteria bacterium]